MTRLQGEEARWAREEFGRAELGDSRRTARLVRMATRAAKAPSGKISDVFTDDAERQGAYDFLESKHVSAAVLIQALGWVAAERGAEESFTFVAIDGSSVPLADHGQTKDFGSVGALNRGGRGLKMINALGVSPSGVPLGLFSQVWWARKNAKSQSRKIKRKHNAKRKVSEKETRYWLQAIDESNAQAKKAGAKLWFELDREGDNQDILLHLQDTGERFTVRGSWDRLVQATGKDKQYLRQTLAREAPGGEYLLDVPAGPKRTARRARIRVRSARVELRLRDKRTKKERRLEVNGVWAREEGTTPDGEESVDWLLLTNAPVQTFEDARHVIFGYTQRWRVEEFHKTWKSGACNVQQTQLRTHRAVVVWATLLAAVAIRIERLKRLSRTTPEQPASVELTPHEIRALILLKRDQKKRTETIPDAMPTIGQATLWIAEIGGYTGKSSGGPPGTITIRRGLERVRPAAQMLRILEAGGRSDQ